MGAIEDSEPPLKRVKWGSSSLEDSSSLTDTKPCSLGDLMARPLPSQGDDGETIGSKGVIKRSEFIKIITRALYSLGYNKSGAILEEESGIPLNSSMVNLFMQQVVDGKWNDSVSTLQTIDLLDEKAVNLASFLILEQKFLELLKTEKVIAALETLRNEIVPLRINSSRVHELATCIISPSQQVTSELSIQNEDVAMSRENLLQKLQSLLPAALIIPEKRLEHLVEQALDVQQDACAFHNALDTDLSLYSDHQCGRTKIPTQTLQVRMLSELMNICFGCLMPGLYIFPFHHCPIS